MKNLIISCVILVIIFATLLFYGVYCNNVTNDLSEMCEGDKIYSIEGVKNAFSYWENRHKTFHLGVNSSLVDDLTLAFAEHLASLETGDTEEKEKTAEALRFRICTLRDAALISWESVL